MVAIKEGVTVLNLKRPKGMYKEPANKKSLKLIRKALRNNATPAECILWRGLQRGQVEGIKFRRQHSIGQFVMDFYSPSLRLGIELDGEVHNDMIIHQRDEEKEAFLRDNGITLLRFPNELVYNHFDYIKERIIEAKNNINTYQK